MIALDWKNDTLMSEDEPEERLPEVPKQNPDLPSRPRKAHEEQQTDYGRMGMAYSVPAALAAPVVVLTLSGAWADGYFRTSPWITLIGAILGLITGLMNMIRIANKLNK